MTKTEQRRINAEIRRLRADRKAWLTGQHLHWGTPWCSGAASPYHEDPVCLGCGVAAWCREQGAPIAARIRELEMRLAGPAPQLALW